MCGALVGDTWLGKAQFFSFLIDPMREAIGVDDEACVRALCDFLHFVTCRDIKMKPVSYTHLTLPTNREV